MSKLNRREFLSTTAVGLALGQPLASAQDPDADSNWIDAHVHVWTPDTRTYPLDSAFRVADMQPPSFTPEQLFAHCRPSGVNRIVLIQMSFYRFDNAYMLDAMAAHPGAFSGVAIVDHRAADVAQQVKNLGEKGVRGFRIATRGEVAKSWPDDEGMARLWRAAADEGLAVCPLINPADIQHVDALCRKFPDNTVVVDHFARVGITGTIDPNELSALCDLARHPNVYVKTSAFYALGKKMPPYTDLVAMIRRVCDAFGPERLMWASDCPFQVEGIHDYDSSIALIRDRCQFLSQADKQHLLRDTAERIFFS